MRLLSAATAVPDREGLLSVHAGRLPAVVRRHADKSLVDQHQNIGCSGNSITTLLDDPTGYGRAIVNATGYLEAIVEQQSGNARTAGPYAKSIPGSFVSMRPLVWKHLPEIEPNPVSKEYYPYRHRRNPESRRSQGERCCCIPTRKNCLALTTRVELAMVDRIVRERKVTQLMLDGATVETETG